MSLVPLSVWLSSRPALEGLTRRVMRGFGAFTLLLMRARPQREIEALGKEWQRMFPSDDDVPITKITEDTVFAEIHMRCGHRGSGNVRGCHRMMEYDRKMLERIGGQLVILRSQSEPSVAVCQLAIRKAGAPIDDLVHAHERVGSEAQKTAS
jgi:hypothetical protein